MVEVPKRVRNFVKVLGRQRRFTMRESNIVNQIVRLFNSAPNQQNFEEIKTKVRELKRVEFRGHFVASGNKVASRMHKMFKLDKFSPIARSKFQPLSKQIKVWYAKLIVDTSKGLWKEVNKKRFVQVDWEKAKQKAMDLKTDTTALLAAERQAGQAVPVKT